ncbi:MAG: hypothetical protein EXR79_05600 [Myxococcales bacterium]|nr:hypothetical protein [Myxococcales bacterium]
MKPTSRPSWALACAAGVLAPVAAAAAPLGALDVGAFAGWNRSSARSELGDAYFQTDVPAESLLFGGRLGLSLHDRVVVEAEVRWAPSDFRSDVGDTFVGFGGAAPVLGWRGLVGLNVLRAGIAQPFIVGGGGGETLLAGPRPGIFHDDTDYVAHVGLGARLEFGERWGARVEARWVIGPAKVKAEAEPELAHAFELQLGVYGRLFGKPADMDGDGIGDDDDRCPRAAEDRDGYEDLDGCPDPDNDGDGVPDERDQCRREPETKNGLQDDDGCPDADGDGDGVEDARDQCGGEKEDQDGFEDGDGCEDPDNDKDGVKDVDDKCPSKPEDRDGFADDDGCPDPDNDGDGVLDSGDKCPGKPETKNGVDDDDGCPDEAKPLKPKKK